MSTTYSNPGLLELTNPGQAPVLDNFTKDNQVVIEKNLTLSVSSYNFGTARCTVKAFKGRWYYEVKILQSGSARLGWATQNYAPENRYEGVGSDGDSYGWDGSKKTCHHDDKKNGNSGTTYGDYWSSNDIIGVLLDFDNLVMSYTRNGKSLGVAFKNIKSINPLMPCCSVYRGCKIEINLGPTFKYQPLGFYGLNATVSASQKKSLTSIFHDYHKKGQALSESLSRDVMKPQGVLALGNDLGAKDAMDPHLLLLAWKMRSKQFFTFYDYEWMVLWANEGVSTFAEMKAAVERWRKDIQANEDNYQSFYAFVFDYLRAQEGDNKSSLGKEDAIMAWELLGMKKRFHFYPQWVKFWQENDRLGVPRDTWILLLKFIEKIGKDVKNYNEDDCWPIVFDDFVQDYLKK